MTQVMMLRNYRPEAPKKGAKTVAKEFFDKLGRIPRDTIVDMPEDLAKKLVRKKIASFDLVLEGEDMDDEDVVEETDENEDFE